MAGLNETPSGDRTHIGFFGRRNAGKSSVVNAVTGQELAIVSETAGTTTDPVYKSMELLPLGPVVIIDTPGFDDAGTLGELRVRKTKQVLNKTDIAILVVDKTAGMDTTDRQLIGLFQEKNLPFLIVYNKSDLTDNGETEAEKKAEENNIPADRILCVSAKTKEGIFDLKEKIGSLKPSGEEKHFITDYLHPGELVMLVIPIDKAAPKGRLILPEQMAVREVLDAGAKAVVIQDDLITETLNELKKEPALVITDSQVFQKAAEDVPENIPLTSFSILMAKYKGLLDTAIKGVTALDRLQDGDTVLIAEGCTHHRQCNDIGTVKLPNWIRKYTGKDILFKTCSGTEFPEDLSPYSFILHCGGCMLNEREVRFRMKCAVDQNVPISNYGISIAFMNGILKRALGIFPELAAEIH